MTLTEFLAARLDEDEAVARAEVDRLRGAARRGGKTTAMRQARDVEAKRRIAERCRPVQAVAYRESDRLLAHAFDETHMPLTAYSETFWPNDEAEATLRDLASVYSDHPDYDEAWRP